MAEKVILPLPPVELLIEIRDSMNRMLNDTEMIAKVDKLYRESGTNAVTAPITVTTIRTCPTCGRKSKQGEFCQGCGTAMQLT